MTHVFLVSNGFFNTEKFPWKTFTEEDLNSEWIDFILIGVGQNGGCWWNGTTLQWRHNGYDGVSNHQPRVYLPNRLFERRSKKTSKLRVTGLCVGNSPRTGEFPAQMASNAENVSIWWRHHETSIMPSVATILTRLQRVFQVSYGKYIALLFSQTINTLRSRQNGYDLADDILKCIFLNENI